MESKFNIQKLVRPNVLAMQAYSSARDEFSEFQKDMVFLDANENPFESGLNRYPDPQQSSLKKLIGQQKAVDVDQLLLGNGSDEVLDLIFRAFCRPGIDNVMSLPPTYGMYKVLAATNDIENREVLLTANFQPNVPAILERVDVNTKLIFICSPNNPTGNLIESRAIMALLEKFNGIVVIDEAYIDFAKAESWISMLAKYPNLVVTQTLSKAFGLAGIRLGICIASPEIIKVLQRIKPPYNINALSQMKAEESLKNITSIQRETNTLIDNKAILLKALVKVNFIERIFPSDANFVLVRVDDASLRYEQLIAKGIVVRNRSSQPLCTNTLRLTIGTKEEINYLIETLILLQ